MVILAAALLFSAFVRCRLREMPLERDEGGMAYIGQLILDGTPPYQDTYHEKLPGIYLAYAAMMAVFGESASGIHLGLMVVNLATIILVFLLARDMFDALAGGIAAAAYALFAVSPSVFGTAAHATHFVALFGVAGAWVLWRALRAEKKLLLFLSGLLFGMAPLMKQHGVFLSAFGAFTVLVHYVRLRPFAWRKATEGLAVFAAGMVLPYAAICLWLWWAGVFDRFWFWTFTYSRNHVSEISLPAGAACFRQQLAYVAAPNWPLWIVALVGVPVVVWAKEARRARWFLLSFATFAFLAVCPGFFFRNHYFIVWLPAVAIFCGAGGSWLLCLARAWPPRDQRVARAGQQPRNTARRGGENSRGGKAKTAEAAAVAPGILLWPAATMLLAAAAFGLWRQREFFLLCTPTRAAQVIYARNPFVESVAIADYLRRHTTPNQRLAVIGSEPQIYFYAKRKAATGHIYAYPLVERQPFARQLQEEMRREIEAAKPEFIVFVCMDLSWLADPDCSRFVYEWAGRYVEKYYRPMGLADIVSPTETDYCWGEQAAQAHPRSSQYVWVFQRKAARRNWPTRATVPTP